MFFQTSKRIEDEIKRTRLICLGYGHVFSICLCHAKLRSEIHLFTLLK